MDDWTYKYNEMDKKIKDANLGGEHKWIDLEDDLDSSILVHVENALSFVE